MTNNQPVVSVDPVALSFDGRDVVVALSKRAYDPHIGELALPGVMLAPGESTREAALRGLRDKAGIDEDRIRYERAGGFNDASNRDPRGATISLTRIALVFGDIEGRPVDELGELPFAHTEIIADALDVVRSHIFTDRRIIPAFLGTVFTTREVAALLNALSMRADGNLARKLASTYTLTDARASAGSRGAPARVFTFNPAEFA